jgi:hypothetical protein
MPATESWNQGGLSGSSGNAALAETELRFPGIDPNVLLQVTPVEIILGESLLTPGLQTAVRVHSYHHNLPIKDLNQYKNNPIEILIKRDILRKFGLNHMMRVKQVVYRIDNRKLFNQNTEEFVIHGCDQSLLNDAKSLVSKMWKCTTPSAVVSDVLTQCVGVSPARMDIESSDPARDYIAENIHPFQVVNQQANAALAAGNDPSFVHYMTFENYGTHHFRSLETLTKQAPMMTYKFDEVGAASGYSNPYGIITHSFPCDFDLLSDLLNGVDEQGKEINSIGLFNLVTKQFNLFGSQTMGCGIGSGNYKVGMTNQDSAGQQNACPDYSYLYLQKRQARMNLLEQDKVALRITVPWYPELHAGKVIRVELQNKNDPQKLNYGSGDYLIASLTHNIKRGGLSTTTMDCVSVTTGEGIVG